MEIDLLDFVEQCRHLTKQALGKHAGEPVSGKFARWIHVVLHCFRLEEDHSYRETPNRLKCIAEVHDALGLDRDELPDYNTVYKSSDRLKMWVWRALLRVSAQQRPQSDHAALNSTFFGRRRASSYFRQQSGNTVQTLKVATLTDVESLAVLDVHITAWWEHDTKTGPQVVRRNTGDLQSVATDNGFQDWHTEYEIAAYGVGYLVHYRGSSLKTTLNNALNRTDGYSQRRMAETSCSTAKHSLDDAVRALGWYRQFRGIVLMFVIISIESLCESL